MTKWLAFGVTAALFFAAYAVNIIDNVRAHDIARSCTDEPYRVFGSP